MCTYTCVEAPEAEHAVKTQVCKGREGTNRHKASGKKIKYRDIKYTDKYKTYQICEVKRPQASSFVKKQKQVQNQFKFPIKKKLRGAMRT